MSIKRFVVEITMVVDDDGTEETFLFSTTPFATGPSDVPASTPVYGYLKNPGSFRQELFSGARVTGAIKPSFGNIVLSNHAPVDGEAGVLDHWVDYGISGARVVVRWGVEGTSYPSSYDTVYIAYAMAALVGAEEVTIRLRDGLQVLDAPVVTEGFAGSGGIEGFGSVPKPKQFVSSDPGFIQPILVDAIKQIYFVQSTATYAHDQWQISPTQEVNPFDVFELGQKIDRVATNYSSSDEMLSTEPSPGTVRYWFGPDSTYVSGWKNGPVYFRLGTPPIGDLRVYPIGVPTDSDHARAGIAAGSFSFATMALRAGVSLDRIATGHTHLGTVLVDDDTTYLEQLTKSSRATQAWFGFTRLDVFRSGYLLDPEDDGYYYGVSSEVLPDNPLQPTTSEYTFTPDRYKSLRRDVMSGMEAPIWQIFVQARKTWPCPVSEDAPEALKDYLTRDPWWATFQGVSDSTKTANPGAIVETLQIETADFPNEFSRRLFLERACMLYAGRRDYFVVVARMSAATLGLELHDVVTLQTHRFGLSAGRKFRIVSITIDCTEEEIAFGLWGGTPGEFTGTVSLVSNIGAPQQTAVQIGRQQIQPFTQSFYGTVSTVAGADGQSVQSIAAFTQDFRGLAVETDPQFANVVLLVRGTSGFADLSSNAISPTTIGTPTNVSESGFFNTEVFRFVRSGTSAVTYSKPSDFLDASTDDFTVEMWVKIDDLTYDVNDLDNRKSFLRFTDGGAMTFRFFVNGSSANQLGIAYPSQTGTGNVGLTSRCHIAFCRNSSAGNKIQAWVNGTRVLASTSTSNFNFDLVEWGVTVINGSNRDAQGYAEELRITKGVARYDGATITVPSNVFPAQ